MAGSQLSRVVGIAMCVAGVGLFGVSLIAQAERSHARASAGGGKTSPPQPSLPATRGEGEAPALSAVVGGERPGRASVAASALPSAPVPAASGAASAPASAASSASAPPASASASASSASSASPSASVKAGDAQAGEEGVFSYKPGQIALDMAENAKLIAFVKGLQRQPRGQIVLEGFGDEAGEAGVVLGKKRVTVLRQVVVALGVEPGRVALATPSEGSPGVVRVRLVEVKAP